MAAKRKTKKEVVEEHDCDTCENPEECAKHSGVSLEEMLNSVIPKPHPTLGMNIHPVGCVRCDSPMPHAMPLGINNELYHCEACGKHSYGPADAENTPCNHCNAPTTAHVRTVAENETIYIGIMCDTCNSNIKADNKEIEAGGVMVRCLTCHTVGVLPAGDSRAKRIRKQFKLEGNKSFGLDIPATGCPRCRALLQRRAFTEDEIADIPIDFSRIGQREESDRTTQRKKGHKEVLRSKEGAVEEALNKGCFLAPTTRTQH